MPQSTRDISFPWRGIWCAKARKQYRLSLCEPQHGEIFGLMIMLERKESHEQVGVGIWIICYFIGSFILFIFSLSLSLWSSVMSHIEYLMYLLVGGIGLVNVCPRCGILLPCFMIWQERNSYTFEDVQLRALWLFFITP